jgi:LPS sulfotransferase NodH
MPAEPRGPSSLLIATTPWSGSQLLCEGLRATGRAGDPRDYFNPLEVVRRSRRWDVLGCPEREFPVRYMTAAVTAAADGGAVRGVSVPWSHQRWLVRMARAALDDSQAWARTDAEAIGDWFPFPRYLYLTSENIADQAARWEQGRRGDFPGTRAIETMITRQEDSWELFFQVHGIAPRRIDYETLLANPEETIEGILGWLDEGEA